ncbi:MAG: lipopolysaccharide kinase InaA family protein [Phycisphaerae bacterium]|nr:lipopolysaccharide kinase InaA family protein [Phycisphaerae bacterium]
MKTNVQIEPQYAAVLAAAGLTEFDAFMERRPDGPPASVHRHRETVPICVNGQPAPRRFFLKRVFRVPAKHARADWLRRRVARSQAWREWEAIARLESARIGVMRRVAVGERRRGVRAVSAFLLVEAVEAERTVADWLRMHDGVTSRMRHRLFAALGETAGRLIRAGLRWPDAHPRHVFAAPADDVPHGWRLWLIDVERVESSQSTPDFWATWVRRLLPVEPTRFEQLAFWSRFCCASGLPRTAPVGEASRMLASTSRFVPLRRPTDSSDAPRGLINRDGVWRDPSSEPLLESLGMRDAAELFRARNGSPLDKPGLDAHRRRERIEVDLNGRRETVFLKRWLSPPLAAQLRRIAGGAPWRATARIEWRAARRLAMVGIDVPRVLLVASEMLGPWECRSALLMREAAGTSLEQWVPQHWNGLSRAKRNAVIAQVAAVARIMHRAGLFHRDLYLSHLFVTVDDAGLPRVSLIDLGRVLDSPLRRERWRIKDLAALHYSAPSELVGRTDRFRFLRAYATDLAGPRRRVDRHARYRRWIGSIESRAVRIARHDRKRGRA